jgi:hypothetical protein
LLLDSFCLSLVQRAIRGLVMRKSLLTAVAVCVALASSSGFAQEPKKHQKHVKQQHHNVAHHHHKTHHHHHHAKPKEPEKKM